MKVRFVFKNSKPRFRIRPASSCLNLIRSIRQIRGSFLSTPKSVFIRAIRGSFSLSATNAKRNTFNAKRFRLSPRFRQGNNICVICAICVQKLKTTNLANLTNVDGVQSPLMDSHSCNSRYSWFLFLSTPKSVFIRAIRGSN